ncbi:hypothetical protein [Bilophila wadsworthia]
MLKISDAINVQVLQLPNDKNRKTAIVSASLVMPDGRVINDICSASPRSPFENENTLELAKNRVVNMIKQKAEPYIKNPQNGSQDDKSRFKGGGDKPASRSQLSLIRNKAQERGKNPEELAASHFGKQLQDIKGYEADSLIKELLTRTR